MIYWPSSQECARCVNATPQEYDYLYGEFNYLCDLNITKPGLNCPGLELRIADYEDNILNEDKEI